MKNLKGEINFIAFLFIMLLSFCVPDAAFSQSHDHHSLDAADGDPADAVFVDNTGNVGIGKTDPQAPLDVFGDLRATVDKHLFVQNIIVPGYPNNRCSCDITPYAIECGSNFYEYDDGGTGCYDWFYTFNPPPSLSQYSLYYMRIPVTSESTEFKLDSHSGSIGIGTENPSEKLSVAGTIESLQGGFKFPDGTIQRTAHLRNARHITVAITGGDYTTISAALAAITPSANRPYVIDVMPGRYIENPDLKSYVHLRGAGRDITIVRSSGGDTFDVNGVSNVSISSFTIDSGTYGIDINSSTDVSINDNRITGNAFGIRCSSSNPFVSNNLIDNNTNNGISNQNCETFITGNDIRNNNIRGIVNSQGIPTIIGNKIHHNNSDGIWNNFSPAVIIGNFINGNTQDGVAHSGGGDFATIQGNTITNNQRYGISIWQFSNIKVLHNRITQNGGSTYTDIYVDAAHSSTNRPNISFNVYDDITGGGGAGQYNVTDRGLAAPSP